MTKILKTYIPGLSMAFTFMILFASTYNIIYGNTKDDFVYFVFEVAVYLIFSIIVDYWVGKINFKKFISHLCAETVILYPFTIGIAIWGNWFGITAANIFRYSLIYIIAMCMIHYYFWYISKQQANEINKLLKGIGNKNG